MKQNRSALSRPAVLAVLAGTALGLLAADSLAGPKGTRVVRGNANIHRQGDLTKITVGNRTILWHESMNIRQYETLQFIQPSKRSRVLNRIGNGEPTSIQGNLLANGKVYIVNPAGVVFGPNSVVDVGQLYAAGGDISNRDFMRGVNHFTNVTGAVSSQGFISADAVHLIGSRVANHGTIVANQGLVTMSVGEDVMIREHGSRIMLRVDGETIDPANGPSAGNGRTIPTAGEPAAIENSGSIRAEGGIVSLGAGDAYSLAVRNSGTISAPGGNIDVVAQSGAVENTGSIDASVASGHAGSVTVQAPTVINRGEVRADAGSGRAGDVEVTSQHLTYLADGSTISASGGSGLAHGGEALVHAYSGDTVMAPGATFDISGGALGGDGGWGEISAGGSLGVHGSIIGEARLDFSPATVLFDPFDIVIGAVGAQDGELLDGIIDAGDGNPTDVFRITPASIEGFAGDVTLEALNDIYITQSIDKNNGGLILDAGNNISFSDETGGFITELSVRADFLDFTAGDSVVERVAFGTHLWANSGDIDLTAETGSLKFFKAHVPTGRTVFLTQAESKLVGAGPFGFIADPENTNLVIRITNGFLIFGGDFGGVTGFQNIGSVDAHASQYVRVEDDLLIESSANIRADDDVIVAGFIHAQDTLNLHAGMDGTGTLSFDRTFKPGLDLWGTNINLRAGNNSGLASASVDIASAAGPSPLLRGPTGGSTNPDSVVFQQDAPIADADLPGPGDFGASAIPGLVYRIESNDSGVTLGSNALVDGTHLTLASETGSTINDALSLIDFTVFGSARLNANITSTAFQTYNGQTVVNGDRLLSGSTMTFNSTLDGLGACDDTLTLNGAAVFNGAVGDAAPLRSLTVNGTTDLAGLRITTCLDQYYNGAFTLADDGSLVSTDAGIIRFGSTIDGAFDLSAETAPGGLIVFTGDVGLTDQLVDIFLSTSYPSGVRGIPLAATIIGQSEDLDIRARSFEVTPRDKFTILGNLDLQADQFVTIGDVVTSGDMEITAPTITLLRRPASDLLNFDGNLKSDAGLDFVSGGDIIFSGNVVLGGDAGGSNPLFGLPGGSTFSVSLPGGATRVNSAASRTSLEQLTFEETVLDQNVLLPEPTGPDDSFVFPVPETPELPDRVQPEVYDLALLSQLAINARGVDAETSVGGMLGRLIYNDMADTPGASRPMSATRFDIQAVMALVDAYTSVFGDDEASQVAAINEAFNGALDSFAQETGADEVRPDEFAGYLAAQPEQNEARAYAARLGEFVDKLERLGLPGDEYVLVRNQLLSPVAPEGLTPDEFARVLEQTGDAPTRDQVGLLSDEATDRSAI